MSIRSCFLFAVVAACAGLLSAPGMGAAAESLFVDEFNGDAIGSHWEIINEDPDSYIVEDGKLLIIGAGAAHIKNGSVANIIRLKSGLPQGNWVATIKFTIPYQTGYETPFLAIYEDKDNQIVTATGGWSRYGGISGAQIYLGSWKRTKGKETSFSKLIWGSASGVAFTADQSPNPILLRITKKGRSYTPAYKLVGMKQTEWIEHEKITVLRPKGSLAFGIFQAKKVNGETPMSVDWFKIEALN